MKLFRNENGSTLLLVVITIAMLTVLGTTVISMSIMNTNMKFTDEKMKSSLYYSEAGIEQIYSVVAYHIDEALIDADAKANSDVVDMKDDTNDEIEEIDLIIEEIVNDVNIQDLYRTKYGELFGVTNISTEVTLTEFTTRQLYLRVLMEQVPTSQVDVSDHPYVGKYNGYETDTFLTLDAEADPSVDAVAYNSYSELKKGYHNIYTLYVDGIKIQEYTEKMVNQYYKAYFNLSANQTQLKQDILNATFYLDNNDTSNSSQYTVKLDNATVNDDFTNFTDLDGSIKDADPNFVDKFVINNVTSTFNLRGANEISIATDIVVITPDDAVPMELTQDLIRVNDNPLWQYSIISQNNIIFNQTNANIAGNVYALGTRPEDNTQAAFELEPDELNSPRNSKNYEGFTLTGNSTDVVITGDLISQSYVQTDEGATNCTLTINNGHVFADSVVVQSGGTPGTNMRNEINVSNGNVYTRDDIELNGDLSHIDIDGSYYGFMNSAKYFNKTSAIIINADLDESAVASSSTSGVLLNNPYIRITGNHASIPNPVTDWDSTTHTETQKDGVYIAGTAYINDVFNEDPDNIVENGKMYQSGESIGIKGNLYAYIKPTTDAGSYDSAAFGLESGDLTAAIQEATVSSKSGLYYYYKLSGSTTPMTAEQRVEYFKAQTVDSGTSALLKNGVRTGNDVIMIDSYEYAQGAVVASDGSFISNSTNGSIVSTFLEDDIVKDFTYIMHFLRHRPSDTQSSDFDGDYFDGSQTNFIEKTKEARVVFNYSDTENPSPFGDTLLKTDPNALSNVPPNPSTELDFDLASDVNDTNLQGNDSGAVTTELSIVCMQFDHNEIRTSGDIDAVDTDDNFLLVGTGVTSPGANGTTTTIGGEEYTIINTNSTNPGTMQGIILTSGKVRTRGNLNYYGSIIAHEEVYFESGNVNMYNSSIETQHYLAELVFKNADLREIFDDGELEPDFQNATGLIEFVDVFEVNTGDVDALRINYNDLLYYQKWRIVE